MSMKCAHCGEGSEKQSPLYMHGKCHISSTTYAVQFGDVVTTYCSACDKVVARFKVDKSVDHVHPFKSGCHPEAETTWTVLHGEDHLPVVLGWALPIRVVMQCSVCDAEIEAFKFLGFAKGN